MGWTEKRIGELHREARADLDAGKAVDAHVKLQGAWDLAVTGLSQANALRLSVAVALADTLHVQDKTEQAAQTALAALEAATHDLPNVPPEERPATDAEMQNLSERLAHW